MGEEHSEGFALSINQFVDRRPNIFLTSFFRSGSTHVRVTLERLLPGYRSATTVISSGTIGNDGYPSINIFAAQMMFNNPSQIFHQHTCGTSGNVMLLKKAEIKPIIMMRDMLDSMVSLRELISTGQPQGIGIYYPDYWMSMDEEEQLWWVVKNLPNFYFTFYLSWMSADIEKHVIWYDQYYKDQVAGIRGILEFAGPEGTVSDDAIRMASETITPESRFKFGKPGRGRQILTPDMINDIADQAMSWGRDEGPVLIKDLMER
jgi:hypothetical protein